MGQAYSTMIETLKPFIGPYAAQLGLAGQFFLAGESSVWSPLFLPLFAAIQYYKNDINQMDNLTFFAGLLPMSTMALYWAQGLLYYHLFDKPKAAIEAKHQKKFPLTPSMFKLIGTVLFNQICLYWPLCYGLTKYMTEGRPETAPLMTLAHIGGFAMIQEALFYYIHIICHKNSFMYQYVHKQHHTHTAPFAFAAEYAHPVEEIAVNILPPMAGFMLTQSDNFTIFLWYAMSTLGQQNFHCGYKMPWVPSFSTVVKFHDDHHKLFNNNYGVFGWLDRLHGTLAPPVEEKMD